jgi:hypothetical protein
MAGKLEREAQQQAVDAYMKNWKKLKRIDGTLGKPLKTRSLPKIEDDMGELSAGTKTMIRKADRVARDVNKEFPEFKTAVDKYNRRYDEFQRQQNNQSVSSKFLSEKRGEAEAEFNAAKAKADAIEAAANKNKNPFGQSANGSGDMYSQLTPKAPNADAPYVRETVMGNKQLSRAERDADSKRMSVDQNYGPATAWRKTLPAHEQAAKDFNALSEQVNNKEAFMAAQEKYAGIAEKITAKLKRETSNPKQTTGLLQSELMSGNPVEEVIQ